MFPSSLSATRMGCDSSGQNVRNQNMMNMYMNYYPEALGERPTQLYTRQLIPHSPLNAFDSPFLYPGTTLEVDSNQPIAPTLIPPYSLNIPLQAIPNNENQTFDEGCARTWCGAHGGHCNSTKDAYDGRIFHPYPATGSLEAVQHLYKTETPLMGDHGGENINLARLSSVSSHSVRSVPPGDGGARPSLIAGAALPSCRPSIQYYSSYSSSRSSGVEHSGRMIVHGGRVSPRYSQNITHVQPQLANRQSGTFVPPIVEATYAPASSSMVLPRSTFACSSHFPQVANSFAYEPPPHNTSTNALRSPFSVPELWRAAKMKSLEQSTERNLDDAGGKDNDCLGSLSNNATKGWAQIATFQIEPGGDAHLALDHEITQDETFFAKDSAIEKMLGELLVWGQMALSSSSLSLLSSSNSRAKENAYGAQDVGVVIQTQAGQVEMDLEVASYLIERLEYVQEQLVSLEAMLPNLLFKYVVAEAKSTLRFDKGMSSTNLGLSKAVTDQPTVAKKQEDSNAFVSSSDIKPIADDCGNHDARFTPTATDLMDTGGSDSKLLVPELLLSRCERIRQFLLDDILLRQSVPSPSLSATRLPNNLDGLRQSVRTSLGSVSSVTKDSSYMAATGAASEGGTFHDAVPLRLIMVSVEGNNEARDNARIQRLKRPRASDLVGSEVAAQQSSLVALSTERGSVGGGSSLSAPSATSLQASSYLSSGRASEQLVAVIATPVRYAQHQLFLTVNTAMTELDRVLRLGQLRNQKELQKMCGTSRSCVLSSAPNTVQDESFLFNHINLQKDGNVFRTWIDRVSILQGRLEKIKKNIDAAVRAHALLRRKVLEILDQSLNKVESDENGVSGSTYLSHTARARSAADEVDLEAKSLRPSTLAFREVFSSSHLEEACSINSPHLSLSVTTKDTLNFVNQLRSDATLSAQTTRLALSPNMSDEGPCTLPVASSRQLPSQSERIEGSQLDNCSHIQNTEERQSSHSSPSKSFDDNALDTTTENQSIVLSHKTLPNENVKAVLNIDKSMSTERRSSTGTRKTDCSVVCPDAKDCVSRQEQVNHPYSTMKPVCQLALTEQKGGKVLSGLTSLHLRSEVDQVLPEDCTKMVTLKEDGMVEGGLGYNAGEAFSQGDAQLEQRVQTVRGISNLQSVCVHNHPMSSETSDKAFVFSSVTDPWTSLTSTNDTTARHDEDPMEYSLRNSNNLFSGFKAFMKAVLRRAASFDSSDDDDNEVSNRVRRTRQRVE